MLNRPATRIEDNTDQSINKRIREQAQERVARLATAPDEDVRRRMLELEYEWDVERAVEANMSLAVVATLLLGRFLDRRFYALTGVVGGFLLNHAARGWCPPLPALRRRGFRTAREIDEEHRALETALRSRSAAKDAAKQEEKKKRAAPDMAEREYIPYTD
ncbi:MAG: hypothetical protein HYZ74_07295 [Elusimicrobia bacterium]|nr:hypothetical protein [Elusimicrobiota bacterium]